VKEILWRKFQVSWEKIFKLKKNSRPLPDPGQNVEEALEKPDFVFQYGRKN